LGRQFRSMLFNEIHLNGLIRSSSSFKHVIK
jgi:hypothetical protein